MTKGAKKRKTINILIDPIKRGGTELLNINFPFPIHKMKWYKNFISNKNTKLPFSEKFSKGVFSLPLYPKLKTKNLYYITNVLKKILLSI